VRHRLENFCSGQSGKKRTLNSNEEFNFLEKNNIPEKGKDRKTTTSNSKQRR
jgi:hypothetical protein